jgi:glucose/arabinose dehydrogenase
VGHARQLRFAPGGDLFVASPATATVGGNPNGAIGGIALLPDDDGDGFADSTISFLPGVPSVQALVFARGSLLYQDGAAIRAVSYRIGDRQPSAPSELIAAVALPQDPAHWPKAMDVASDGTVYVTNGGAPFDRCLSMNPARGAVSALAAGGTTTVVAKGFRNPIALRCEPTNDVCLVIELGPDDSRGTGGREKLAPLRLGDDWGFPCCATRKTPYAGTLVVDDGGIPDCSGTVAESDSFPIGSTPFGIDFENGHWPDPWKNRAFVTMHGQLDPLTGAGIVGISLDPSNGMPALATELGGGQMGGNAILQFASGWDQGDHGRPAPIAFAQDGRMFVGDDNKGLVFWVAPVGLMR